MVLTLDIPQDSRFKDTGVIFDSDLGETFFEMWERPADLKKMIENADTIIVRSVDIGRLDLIAKERYGEVKLWWIIAAINNLIDPLTGMYAGQRLFLPKYEDVIRFTSRGGHVTKDGGV